MTCVFLVLLPQMKIPQQLKKLKEQKGAVCLPAWVKLRSMTHCLTTGHYQKIPQQLKTERAEGCHVLAWVELRGTTHCLTTGQYQKIPRQLKTERAEGYFPAWVKLSGTTHCLTTCQHQQIP